MFKNPWCVNTPFRRFGGCELCYYISYYIICNPLVFLKFHSNTRFRTNESYYLKYSYSVSQYLAVSTTLVKDDKSKLNNVLIVVIVLSISAKGKYSIEISRVQRYLQEEAISDVFIKQQENDKTLFDYYQTSNQ
ncbi:Hypothetical_protein [Hexamita inflata]|uniref:Hypothetical_protein n=1 Tax=Hexamita inflata TaxID=28002 RepID=A0AA86T967_9EUKA|nr:Hypothetical protein HINF_LOCUS404 [Hexamita inflata]